MSDERKVVMMDWSFDMVALGSVTARYYIALYVAMLNGWIGVLGLYKHAKYRTMKKHGLIKVCYV